MKNYFSTGEKLLWGGSVLLILAAFFVFDRANYLNLAASLIGVTSLIFAAKANPAAPALMIVFSALYGIISFGFSYYGEMITYLGMTLPMSVISLISWLRNPFDGKKSEVGVNRIHRKEVFFMLALSLVVTVGFYFILKAFGTANLPLSTLSVTTSFIAVYLTFRRSPFYAAGYAANDVVLIILWILAARENPQYVSVAVCFGAFLVNDVYGFISWRRIQKRQSASE
ncbi:MAG: nicotinamide riboside transporter PnuC [Oscillospiraceae bacterium]|nr:nicotinamide riboside transporter PnuC [Oscillospiraceae bacterium]